MSTAAVPSVRVSVPEPTVPFRRRPRWSNWGKTAHCQPDYLFFARTPDDLMHIVHFAGETNRKLRAVTTGHSWSALVPTDDILVDVTGLNRVELDLTDAEQPRVRVECGATVAEVNAVLERAGYALPFNVVLESVRFGGLIATGSHGSGWHHQTLSDQVYSIDIIGADGELRHFEAGIDSEEVMSAVRLNLGMFGLIWRMTLDILPTWRVLARDRRVPIAEALERLPEWVTTHDNCDYFWWPFTRRVWVKTWSRVEAPITARPRYDRLDRFRSMVEMRVYQGVLETMRHAPRLTPKVIPMTFPFTPSQREEVLDVVEAIHYRRSIEMTVMGCLEIAFKVDSNFANARDAIQTTFELTRLYAARSRYPLNVTMNIRFIHNSGCLLSPAYGEGHTCYIEVLSRAKQPAWEGFAAELALEWLKLPHALPHWAKEFAFVPGITEHIQREMGHRIARFNQIKAELGVDPEHRFVNGLLRSIFLG